MAQSDERLAYLFRQYTGHVCTQDELGEFFSYLRDPANRAALETMMDGHLETMPIPGQQPSIDWEDMYTRIVSQPDIKPTVQQGARDGILRVAMWRFGAVAAAVLLVSASLWLYFREPRHTATPAPVAERTVQPGYNKAVLTLGDGSLIPLDSSHTGELTRQGNVPVINGPNGSLSYGAAGGGVASGSAAGEHTAGGAATAVVYNTVTTPRGGQYQVVLPDGTKVWLNAASSITYPTTFAGAERIVQITGEVYFEVVHSARKPFRVKTPLYEVEDIGTRFNVNAYSDEAMQVTTLIDGVIRVGQNLLKPGQQAAAAAGGAVLVSKGDPVQAIAWKNGFFDFSDASLQVVMRQLSRWYNVDVQYEGNIRPRKFTGMIGRSLTLAQVLRGLSKEGVHYRLEGNNHLIITP